jgi:hypothetical protein
MRPGYFTCVVAFVVLAGLGAAGLPRAAGQAAAVADATTAVLEADDTRIAALTTVDEDALESILDDDLHYAHSNGTVDTKQSFIDSVMSGRLKYVEYEPSAREVTFPRAGIAIVTGRADVVGESDKGRNELALSYLAVWRHVGGEWKFLAWQSARLPKP